MGVPKRLDRPARRAKKKTDQALGAPEIGQVQVVQRGYTPQKQASSKRARSSAKSRFLSKSGQMTYKTGSIGEFMKWTKRIITEPAAAAEAPKRWFDTDETAARVLGTTTSPEAMVKLLSKENLVLLHLIATKRPSSVRELATLVKRKESNLSRTLRKLQKAGIVSFEQGPGRTRAPRLVARRVTLDLDLAGAGSVVSLERTPVR